MDKIETVRIVPIEPITKVTLETIEETENEMRILPRNEITRCKIIPDGSITSIKIFPAPKDTGDIEEYKGSYTVTPSVKNKKKLNTKHKKMLDDVTVLEVPLFRTSNEEGGVTVYIGKGI